MKHDEYFPNAKGDQPEWLNNVADKMVVYTGTLGLDPLEAAARANDARCAAWYIGAVGTAVRDFAKAYTSAVDVLCTGSGAFTPPAYAVPDMPDGVTLALAGVLVRLFAYIKIIKASPGYTEAIGIDMGIVGAVAVDTHAVPEFTLKSLQGPDCHCAQVSFNKYGRMGVVISSRVGNGPWEELAVATSSPYVDSRPLAVAGQPEVREYRLRFWDKGSPVGEWTAVQRITIAP